MHQGHAASRLSGDVIARYYRLKGDNVCLVIGSDCHGTLTDVKALQENKSQKEISFNLYNRTDNLYHKEFVQDGFKKY